MSREEQDMYKHVKAAVLQQTMVSSSLVYLATAFKAPDHHGHAGSYPAFLYSQRVHYCKTRTILSGHNPASSDAMLAVAFQPMYHDQLFFLCTFLIVS